MSIRNRHFFLSSHPIYWKNEAICKSRNGELGNGMRRMRGMGVGMQGMGWEYGEYNWNRKNKMKVYKIQFSFLVKLKKAKLELQ